MPDKPAGRADRAARVRAVIDRLTDADDAPDDLIQTAITSGLGAALSRWVLGEQAAHTIEIGLGYGISALYIIQGLVQRDTGPRHVVIDPFQGGRYANRGLQALEEAGAGALVEHYAEPSQLVLPRLLEQGRQYDLAFVDGNHRFDSVFVDLFYLARVVRKGGIIMLDDYDYPAIERAVAFWVANLGWTIQETAPPDDGHGWVVLRTPATEDTRDFRYFVEF